MAISRTGTDNRLRTKRGRLLGEHAGMEAAHFGETGFSGIREESEAQRQISIEPGVVHRGFEQARVELVVGFVGEDRGHTGQTAEGRGGRTRSAHQIGIVGHVGDNRGLLVGQKGPETGIRSGVPLHDVGAGVTFALEMFGDHRTVFGGIDESIGHEDGVIILRQFGNGTAGIFETVGMAFILLAGGGIRLRQAGGAILVGQAREARDAQGGDADTCAAGAHQLQRAVLVRGDGSGGLFLPEALLVFVAFEPEKDGGHKEHQAQ